MKSIFSVILIALIMPTAGFAGGDPTLPDGLYAVWETNHGIMTGKLHHVEAPIAVANFVGLAEGTKTWIEEDTGLMKQRPYYDGHIAFRIAELGADANSTIIQTGSQNNTNGGGGPGYRYQDEFDDSLIHGAGSISMANSGPHSNGTQYFFSRGSQTHLDGVHTIIGQIVGGLSVLDTMAAIPRNGTVPSTPVIFNRVRILRIGTEAQQYDPSEKAPMVETLAFTMTQPTNTPTAVGFDVLFEEASNTTYRLLTGVASNQLTVVADDLNLSRTGTTTRAATTPAVADQQFIIMQRIRHTTMYTPLNIRGTQFNGTYFDAVDQVNKTVSFYLNAAGSAGTLAFENQTHPLTGVSPSLDTIHALAVEAQASGHPDHPAIVFTFNFSRPKNEVNRFTANVFNPDFSFAFSIEGTFTFTDGLP